MRQWRNQQTDQSAEWHSWAEMHHGLLQKYNASKMLVFLIAFGRALLFFKPFAHKKYLHHYLLSTCSIYKHSFQNGNISFHQLHCISAIVSHYLPLIVFQTRQFRNVKWYSSFTCKNDWTKGIRIGKYIFQHDSYVLAYVMFYDIRTDLLTVISIFLLFNYLPLIFSL